MTSRNAANPGDDSGVTLVELIVYIAVAALFLGLMAGIFAAGLRTESATRDRTTATGKAQVVSDSIATSIRNASAFQIDGKLLRARVATGASGWECRAWVLTAGGDLAYKTSTTAIPSGNYTGWKSLATGVVGTKTAGSPFAASGNRLDLGYSVTQGASVVAITNGVTAQAVSTGGTPTTCW
ncbi:hypothetical protein [Microbacterium sp.]|uniref:hypothetical protein n=1 Tax=Microbacterium sp. TaxID=51671 RepID=UPI003F70C355